MLTKGAIGNLVNRYKAVLKKCNLINVFGSLAVASMLVLSGAGVAEAGLANVIDKITYMSNFNTNTEYKDIDLKDLEEHSLTVTGAVSLGTDHTLAITDSSTDGWVKINGGIDLRAGAHSIQATKEINITSGSPLFLAGGSLTLTTGDIVIKATNSGSNAIQAQGAKLTINATTVDISASGSGRSAIRVADPESSSAQDVSIVADTVRIDAPYVVKSDNSAASNVTTSITAKKHAEIIGDIQATNNANITLGITGKDSFIKGTITDSASGSGVTLGLSDAATWTPTAASNLSTLNAEGGVIDMSVTTGNVAVDKLGGSGVDVVMNTGEEIQFQVADNSAEVKVTAKAASGNADTLTTDDAEAMAKRVTTADGTTPLEGVTAEVAEGIVNAGFTTDSEGKIVSGGGASSVTKAVLEAASVNTVALDKILTNDVRKRLGDIRSDANKTGVWMRWDGGKLKGEGLTNNFNTIQIGGDTKVAKNCRLGVAGSFTHGDGDFARGSSEMEGFSFAAYATWMGDNGMFADIVARLGSFSTEVNVEGQSGDMDNRVASISGEYGWRFNLSQQFFIEPQVELAYTYVNSDDLELETAKFSFASVDSFTGRVGLVAGWNLPDDRGNVYARASVVQQFMGDAKVTGFSGVAPTVHETDGDDTWVEYGIGANVKLTDSTYIWADVERTEGAEIDEEWRGTVGIRYSF